MNFVATYGDYAPDAVGETAQERIHLLEEWRNLCLDIELDARNKAEKASKEISKLKYPTLEDRSRDDEL